ncbi:MAG: HD domain-containing protein [Anaerosomatales bacterium]|nr:HD domain-containing protein [Anaerosomatales bacterium]
MSVGREVLLEEVAGIPHRSLSLFVARTLAEAPEGFWTAPASAGGNRHPEWARGEGGLVLHTIAVMRVARSLFGLFEIVDRDDQAVVLSAAALHDVMKGWDGRKWGATRTDHGERAAGWIGERDGDPVLAYLVSQVCACVRSHMVQWAGDPVVYSTAPRLVSVVATADYVASRPGLVWDSSALPVLVP